MSKVKEERGENMEYRDILRFSIVYDVSESIAPLMGLAREL